jgi:hypothetical protein
MIRCNPLGPMGYYNRRQPARRPNPASHLFTGPGKRQPGQEELSGISQLLQSADEKPTLAGYRKFSPFRKVDWAKLGDNSHHSANEQAIYALLEDLRDRKALFKLYKSASFKAALASVAQSVSFQGKGALRDEQLQAAERLFLKAAAEFPFHYLKAEAYRSAAIVAKVQGNTGTRLPIYLECAKHHYEASAREIDTLQRQTELSRIDQARIVIGLLPSLTEWLLRMSMQAPSTQATLKPSQTWSARILMPVAKMNDSFLADEMEKYRQDSDIPELYRQLSKQPSHSEAGVKTSEYQSLDEIAY